MRLTFLHSNFNNRLKNKFNHPCWSRMVKDLRWSFFSSGSITFEIIFPISIHWNFLVSVPSRWGKLSILHLPLYFNFIPKLSSFISPNRPFHMPFEFIIHIQQHLVMVTFVLFSLIFISKFRSSFHLSSSSSTFFLTLNLRTTDFIHPIIHFFHITTIYVSLSAFHVPFSTIGPGFLSVF